jgi:replicative DNA helicase
MNPGQLVVVAGRPGMGKSAIALNMVRHVCLMQKRSAAYFSMEMSQEELTTRLIADLGNLHGIRASHGRISDSEWQAIGIAGSAISGAPIYLNDSAALTITEITTSSRRLAREAESPLSLVVIDYLGLMRTERQTSNRAQDIAEVSRGLKALAKELKLPVMLLAQLNRECEKRGDKRPVLSDLRDSGEIEADADMVWMLYRDEVYADRDDNKGHAELLIRKQRNGPIGTVKLRYDGARTRFSDWDNYP